jgi:hypothetical protein
VIPLSLTSKGILPEAGMHGKYQLAFLVDEKI